MMAPPVISFPALRRRKHYSFFVRSHEAYYHRLILSYKQERIQLSDHVGSASIEHVFDVVIYFNSEIQFSAAASTKIGGIISVVMATDKWMLRSLNRSGSESPNKRIYRRCRDHGRRANHNLRFRIPFCVIVE